MDTSRKTEINTTVEGAAAEGTSAATQPCTSSSDENLLSGEERINRSADDSTGVALPTRDRKRGGPRTALGKQKSRFNARKHGIFSEVLLLDGEPRAQFDSLRRGLRSHFEPEGMPETILTDKLAVLTWRLRRLIIADRERKASPEVAALIGLSPDLSLRYESTLERSFDRTLNQLERLQRVRKAVLPTPPANRDLL